MKLKIILITFISLINISAADFGVKVGVNHLTRGGEDVSLPSEYITNLNFGLIGILPIVDRLDIQIEILYDTYGYKIKIPVINSNGTYIGMKDIAFKYTYLNLPILLSVRIFEFEQIQSKVYLGSNVAFLLDVESNLKFERRPNFPEDETNTITYGFIVGTNFFLNIAERQFIIDMRYFFSFNAIVNYHYWDRGYHKSISLSVGYLF